MIPSNQVQLRQLLLEEIQALRDGKATPERVNAVSHAANVALKSITQQMNYAAQRGEKPFCELIKQEQ
jgi:hypothetical protein